MGQKMLQLAIFAEAKTEGAWAARMKAWNESHPQWHYSETSNFQRDVAQARKRLLNPPVPDSLH